MIVEGVQKKTVVIVFSVSETGLNSDIPDSELAIESYSFTRQDRIDRKGGGCMVYVRKIFHIVYDLICWIKALNLALLK